MSDTVHVPSYTSSQCVVTKNALDVIFFHPCETVEDFYKPRVQFSPLFCHHFFGEAEQVIGDEDLKIRIFYTPDTFEAFLKVEGRPVLLVEENKVETALVNGGNAASLRANASGVASCNGETVGSKRTVLECLLERTPFPGGFCNTQTEFIQKIRNRKQIFIPPGEVVAECMLGKELFQIRECIFTDNKHDASSVINTNTSIIGGVSSFSSISSSCTVSAASSASGASFHSSSSLSSSSGNSTISPYKFDSLHRRIEWFLHWFIESASPIDHDSRWRILLPYIVKGKHHISQPWVSHNTFVTYVQRKFNEYYELHEENKIKINHDFIATKQNENKGIKTIINGVGAKEENQKLVTENNDLLNHAPTLSLAQSRSKRLRKAGGREEEESEYSWHLAGMASTYTFFTINKDRRRISQFMIFPHMQSKGMGMKLLEYIYIQAMLDENVAEITVEDPAASFSQLRDVVSLKLCFDFSFLSKYCLYPSNFRKNIENKKSEKISFFDKNLSYIKSHLESSHRSYIKKEKSEDGRKLEKDVKNEKENQKQNNAEEKSILCNLPDKRLIIAVTKETSRQATRILETLRLANVMPHPMPMPPTLLFTPLQIKSEIPRDWRLANIKIDNLNTSIFNANLYNNGHTFNNLLMDDNNYCNRAVDDLFCDSNACKELRVSVKKRMRREHMEELSEISATGIRAELDYRWKEHYASLYRTIRKLRLIFPL